MPELPEVESLRRALEPHLLWAKVEDVQVLWPRTIGGEPVASFAKRLGGALISAVDRRGKWIVLRLSEREDALFIHLRMSGLLRIAAAEAPRESAERLRVVFRPKGAERRNRKALVFLDPRKFGRVLLARGSEPPGRALGPEPFDPALTPRGLQEVFARRRVALKTLLLDQSLLAGIGNIYADEALFLSRISPLARPQALGPKHWSALLSALRTVLAAAIEAKGTSFDRFYRTLEGEAGAYQGRLQVYGRGGEPCRRCTRPLKSEKLAQRTTVYCPRCQKSP